ncbi:type II toxin-antitoxin system HicB family antitoxin [Kamptonema animale CS-326]|jgi:predicted RNase H-like HicB family nuclease|uniref:type II toxin-antitoxin system HicB family antitoxin n=1 Tax=Kamptonema animale TaxID=92934 RepID=UPI00232ADC0F|nr:type II toxin-antitoxin system HicB family antitoxin [Kamptonema animale]MDB9512928.1 type II toxin-antitoxin system HicB family antitoxin [Kamptonema animale CS-326]
MTTNVTAPSEKSTSEKSTKLTYPVMLEKQENEGYRATVLGWPECQAFGSTREEALTSLRQIVTERLDKVEIVSLEIDRPKPEHPWMKFAGMFKDDPYFDEMQADIAALRRERDEQMEAYYRQIDAEEETK